MKVPTISFSRFSEISMQRLRTSGRFATAHLYHSAICSYKEYLQVDEVQFAHLSKRRLKSYNDHLIRLGKHPNTISTYMRMLRSIYNQAVDQGRAPYISRQFHDVFTGVEVNHKRATSADDVHKLLSYKVRNNRLKRTQDIASLLFFFSGIPFVDFTHLKSAHFKDGVLHYYRSKTQSGVSVPLIEDTHHLIERLRNKSYDKDKKDKAANDNYLFGILKKKVSMKTIAGYLDYQNALHRFNRQLKRLAKEVGIEGNISSYTFRHSWATTAIRIGTPIEKVSQMLGHKSIKTTQTYFSGYDITELMNANRKTCDYMLKGGK